MKKVSCKHYSGAITKEQIEQAIETLPGGLSTGVENIQEFKEYIVSNIFSTLELDGTKVQGAEEEFMNSLQSLQNVDESKADFALRMKEQVECMYKSQSFKYYLGGGLRKRIKKGTNNTLFDKFKWKSKREIFQMTGDEAIGKEEYYKFLNLLDFKKIKQSYLSSFEKFSTFPLKYNGKVLSTYKDDPNLSAEEKYNLDVYTSSVLSEQNKRNTRSRTISFDKKLFNDSNEEDEKNIKCFLEMDFNGNKRYFSYNDLINDIEVFGIEVGIPKIDQNSIPEDIRKKYFPSMNRRIKATMYKNLLGGLRDQQESLMYGFKNYDLKSSDNISYKSGLIAEKVVEWYFRKLANFNGYNITIQKASIGEDIKNKVDLFVKLEDKKTGVNVEKQLQFTLKKDILVKEMQINKRKKNLQDAGSDFTDIELVQLTLGDLSQKLKIWQFFNRPVGGIEDLLDSGEKELIETTFDRIVGELNDKKSKL